MPPRSSPVSPASAPPRSARRSMPATCLSTFPAAAPEPMPVARAAREDLDCRHAAWWRAAPASRPASPEALHRKPFDVGGVPQARQAVPPRQDQYRGMIGRDQGRRGASARGAGWPPTCSSRCPPRPVLAGADRWGVLGSGIKHYRSHSCPISATVVVAAQCAEALGTAGPVMGWISFHYGA